MAFELPQAVLRKLRELYKSNPLQLSDTEKHIGERIEICSACNYCWYRRAKKRPERCPNCHSRAWDRPLVAALVDAHRATHPNEPFTPPKGGAQ
jgi:predicted Zn-ribbon and HTH transcriptional regulator